MTTRLKLLFFSALIVVAPAFWQACSRAEGAEIAPGSVRVLVEWAPGDTALVIASYRLVQGSFPIAEVLNRILDADSAEIRRGIAPPTQLVDTLLLPDLLPGESYGPYRFGASATDDRGNRGAEVLSTEFTVTRGFTPPGVADLEVSVDTLALDLERAGWRGSLGALPAIDSGGSGVAEYEIVGEGGYVLACEQVLLVDLGDSLVVAGREWCPEPVTFAFVRDPQTGERLNPVQLVSELTYATIPVR